MVARFDRHGIRFQYPENWQVSDDSNETGRCCITLQSPNSGFWMLQLFDDGRNPEKLIAEVLRSVRQEYDSVEAALVHEPIQDTQTVGYDMQFYCLDFVVSAKVCSFELGDKTCVVLYQAEDREFDELKQVFLAITTSLCNSEQ